MSDNNIYYDLSLSNLPTNDKPIPLQISESRLSPYLYNAERYRMSVVRFQFDSNLPVFRAYLPPNSTSSTQTSYRLIKTLHDDNGVDLIYNGEKYIEWIPQNPNKPLPTPPSETFNGFQDNSNSYYDTTSYNHLCFVINRSLISAELPYILTYDTNTLSFYLEYTTLYGGQPAQVEFGMNQALADLFQFPTIKKQITINGKTETFSFINTQNNLFFKSDTEGSFFPQEASTIQLLSPITNVFFSTSNLPINQGLQNANNTYIGGISTQVSSGNNTNNIITDFIATQYRPNLMYVPSVYRWIDLYGNDDLYNIQISAYWTDREGNTNQIFLTQGQNASIKLLFQLKD